MRHARAIGQAVPLAASLLLCAFSGVEAGEAAYCVTCRGPDQTYLCRVNGEAIGRNDAVKLYCVERTAKEGGHASCGARDASAGCNGVEKTYSYNGPDIPEGLAEDPRVKKLMDRVQKEQKAFDKEDRKSLVEVTGQAVSASRRGIRNMRASIAGRDEPEQNCAARKRDGRRLCRERAPAGAPWRSGAGRASKRRGGPECSLRRYAASGERGPA